MNAAEFVANWRREKDELLRYFMGEQGDTLVAARLDALGLSFEQLADLRGVLDAVLQDTMYTLLLGLDGATSIGVDRRAYKIFDEDGSLIASGGELEAEAWKQFQTATSP
jgi:hypothetical protein